MARSAFLWFFTESWGSKQGIRRSPKSCTRKEHESATNPIAKRGQGAMPLAGSRDSVPCGVWGNAPTVPRATNSKEEVNKGAGSEASLPVTSRSRRSAPKPLYQPLAHCRARWARPTSIGRSRFSVLVFFVAGRFRLCGGDQRALRSPSGLLRIALPCFLIFHVTGGIAPACAIRAQQNRTSPFENALP